MKYINFSEQESNFTKLRMGRTNILDNFDPNLLLEEIFELQLDICRIKVDISNPDIFNLLDKIKFPKRNFSFLIEQYIDLQALENEFEIDIKFKKYSISQKNELLQLVKEIQDSDTYNRYFIDDFKEKILPNNILNEVVANYQTIFDNNINKSKHCYLAYKEDKLIGFCTLDVNNEKGEGVLVGIIPKYRSLDLFKNFVRQQINQSKKLGCKQYICKTIAFNHRSLNTTLKQGMKVSKIILNINIYPMLNLKSNEKINIIECEMAFDNLEFKIAELLKKKIKIIEYHINRVLNENKVINIKIFEDLKTVIFINLNLNFSGYLVYEIII
jgi:hypothetical protein